MAVTQTMIDELREAIASGIKSVTYSGPPSRTIQYQDTDAMMRALALMETELSTANETRRPYRLIQTKNGFDT